MSSKDTLGGIIHTYQQYDPVNLPGPAAPAPDLVSPAFEHLLHYGSMRELTEEELARAVHLDPSQIQGLGPSLDHLKQILEDRKRKILEMYETAGVKREANDAFHKPAKAAKPPAKLAAQYQRAVKGEQLRDLEMLWYQTGDERGEFAKQILKLVDKLGEKYQVDALAAKYEFTGRTPMSVPEALEIKQELEEIDRLLKQLEEAAKTAQIAIIDLDALAEYAEPGDIDQLRELRQQVENYLRQMAEQQGLEQKPGGGFQLTPKAFRIFQSKILEQIFSELTESRTGRHQNVVVGEGATELQQTKPYEFGDSVANMDIPASIVNALLRGGRPAPGGGVRMKPEDIEVHRTRNTPKCATAVLLDMSGSMGYDAQYVNVKRMGLALDGLIRKEYPGDFLQFVEMYSVAKVRHVSEVVKLMPKPVTIRNPVVNLWADMSDPRISERDLPPHFTNIQHALLVARKMLSVQSTPNRQVVLITDGLPTAHFDNQFLRLMYPPSHETEEATLREGKLCAREGIVLNIFLLSNWNQSEEDIRFAYRLAESTRGRVFFPSGRDLDRFVVWDYIHRRKLMIS